MQVLSNKLRPVAVALAEDYISELQPRFDDLLGQVNRKSVNKEDFVPVLDEKTAVYNIMQDLKKFVKALKAEAQSVDRLVGCYFLKLDANEGALIDLNDPSTSHRHRERSLAIKQEEIRLRSEFCERLAVLIPDAA